MKVWPGALAGDGCWDVQCVCVHVRVSVRVSVRVRAFRDRAQGSDKKKVQCNNESL